MDELTEALLVTGIGWTVILVLGLADARVARAAPSPASSGAFLAQPAPPAWTPHALWVLALLMLCVRAPLAIGREVRQVDEYQYAATVAFAEASGEGLLGSPVGVRGVTLLFALGDPWDPWPADLLTSLAVAATGLLLGQTMLQALQRAGPALLITVLYPLATLRFEGLTCSGEAWAALALAGWARLRLAGPDDLSTARRVAAGLCLGLAVLAKEHALPFLALAPAFAALELRAQTGPARWRAFLERVGLALAGAAAPLLLVAAALAVRGTLGTLLAAYLSFGRGLGDPGAVGDAPDSGGLLWVVLDTAGGLLTCAIGPASVVGGLGLIQLLRRTGELGTPPATPSLRLAHGAALLGLLGLFCSALGLRFFGHYFQLALPGLTLLVAWRLADALREVRAPGAAARWLAAVQLGLCALLGVFELSTLGRVPRFAEGNSLDRVAPEQGPSDAALARQFAGEVARVVPPERPVLVWGWRPELYAFARRAPSSRWLAGWLLRTPPPRILDDLERWPPAAVLVPGSHGILPAAEEGQDPFALDRHPWLVDWLRAHRFKEVGRLGDYVLLRPR